MTRLRLFSALALLTALSLPALALAAVKRGTYIEVKTQTYIVTNKAATSIKSLSVSCIVNGQQSGGNLITKPLKITGGKFSFSGKTTLRTLSKTVIEMKVTGTFGKDKIKGTVSYSTPGVTCANRSYSAKYYGVNPQG